MACAISSLPVPDSPRSSTVVLVFATCATCPYSSSIARLAPTMLEKP